MFSIAFCICAIFMHLFKFVLGKNVEPVKSKSGNLFCTELAYWALQNYLVLTPPINAATSVALALM